jgi:hypothetical protein
MEPMSNRAEESVEGIVADPRSLQAVIERDLPMLGEDWGAKDEDALIHTLGMNLLASLGRAAGYLSLVEYPVPRAARWQRKLVRVDVVWIDRQTRQPILLAEFERFSKEGVLEKQANLCVAAHGCERPPDVLLLCCWALDGAVLDVSFYDPDAMLPIPGGGPVKRPDTSRFLLIHAVFGRRGERLRLLKLRRLA